MSEDGWRYLHRGLAPLAPLLARGDVTDLYVNRPGEVWIETLDGATERLDVPVLDAAALRRLVEQVAAFAHQGISRAHPLLSATLPGGERMQVIAPPATRGALALAIRRPVVADLSLDDLATAGAFAPLADARAAVPVEAALDELRARGDIARLLRAAVRGRRNILVSGGTSSGKTAFLDALLREIPPHERLITIEDVPELRPPHANHVGLVAVRGALGEAEVSADDLVTAALRMRPDRIILGELRGGEAFAFLRAINTGHPGSMATVHADSAAGAVEQIALLVLQGGTRLCRADVLDYVRGAIHVFVQLGRVDGRRVVTELVVR
ncbi:P-type DNA transfer ATPase VirB11 [Sphingomonas sp. RRHST34]|uniref:Type IV secretion system protein n=1 Tax=Sphingomonas citri TaxID=2862499 RepID=A0ABS7BQ31_9SPHN|nr:P-type DNA transfer ATPase VirB11 [Sphingomonas citri]MBW6531722.1 P-type DNA transfer ATPase VirB11 [Sphingomonas citri]